MKWIFSPEMQALLAKNVDLLSPQRAVGCAQTNLTRGGIPIFGSTSPYPSFSFNWYWLFISELRQFVPYS